MQIAVKSTAQFYCSIVSFVIAIHYRCIIPYVSILKYIVQYIVNNTVYSIMTKWKWYH